MKIFKSDDTLLIDVEVNDSSYRFRELMGKDELNLEFSLPVYLEIPLGCYCSFQNQKYELLKPSNVTVKHRREFEYQVLFEASWGRMRRWVVINRADGSVEFPLTAKPIEHLNQLVWNLNQRDGEGTWTAGDCIDASDAVISYAFTKCDKALADIATTFNCEWEIVDHTISLHKLEYNKNNPLRLEYGNNNGFRSGVKRTNDGDSLPIGTLYVQGSEKNIDFSSYPGSGKHSKRLLLPRTTSVSFDGEHFSDETGYVADRAMRFVTDENGYSVKRTDSPHGVNTNEESLDLPNIYPSRLGTVSAVKYIYDGSVYTYDELVAIAGLDWDKVQIDIIDSSIPSSLDYWADNVRIAGETMTVVFQNGMLAGKEFDIQKFYKNADEFLLGNRFELVRTEIDGICMPNATYRVYGTGEVQGKDASTYIVFNCALPQSYITDAEKELLREALKYLYSHQDPKFSFTGELDPMWAKRNWLNVGSKIAIGGYVNFVDKSLAPAPEPQDVGVLVRIISVKDFVNNPYCPTIELSTSTQAKSLATSLRQAESEYVATGEKIDESVQLSKRSFRNALETSHMLEEALESFKGEFSESVTPITIRTMSLLVGSENLQFKFIRSFTNLTDAPCPIHWDNNAKKLICDESYLQHITLGIDDLAPKAGRTYDEYYIWRMKQWESAVLVEELAHTPYYIYAKVPVYNKETAKESQRVGDFIISTVAIGKDDVEGFYHLLCGTLSSETECERSFARLYGFTEILPGQITTDVIRSADGTSFFDLVNQMFALGEKLKYNVNGDDALVLNGTFVQTGNGDIVKMGAYCGPYESDRIYALGDEVTAEVGSVISSYRYINAVPSRGNPVTDTNYWEVFAKGEKGEKGEKGDSGGQASFKSIVFTRTNSEPDIPTGGSFQHPIPDEIPGEPVWSDGVPSEEAQLWMSTRIFTSDGSSPQQDSWTTPSVATDTADIDFEWSERETVTNPDDDPKGYWHNTATKYDIWMAVRKKKNGIWGSWEVSKIKGENGKDGKGLTQINEYYQASTSGTTVPLGTWTKNSIPSDFGTSKKFLWNYEEIVYSTGDVTTTSPSVIGVYGKDGKSISSIVEYYQASTSKTTVPTGRWTQGTTPSDFDANKPYLWNYERINYSDGTHDDTEPAMIGHYGRDGKDGEDGVSPNTSFKSIVFQRSNTTPTKPAPNEGSYDRPYTDTWTDGVPEGDAQLWMCTRIFSNDGKEPQQPEWSDPQPATDTADIDIEWSSLESPTAPVGHPNVNPDWKNEALPGTIWMAVSRCKNGVWGDWEVLKIKGENGKDGTGITIVAHIETYEDLPTSDQKQGDAYVCDNDITTPYGEEWKARDLIVWDGDSWYDAGPFQGEPGKSSYLHIKYAYLGDDGKFHFTEQEGEVPGDYIGTYVDTTIEDSKDIDRYAPWKKWKGEDGFGYEYIFALTNTKAAPAVPDKNKYTDEEIQQDDFIPNKEDVVWADNPGDVSADMPYCWECYRQKVDGKWQWFKGSATQEGKAALYSHYGKDGDSGQGVFKSFVFKRATSQPSVEGLGGDYLHPVPTEQGWSDGVPEAGEGEVWMTTRVFTSDGNPPQEPSWTEAQMITDTADIDFEFSSVDGTGFMVKEDLCISCGLCYDSCPAGAISVGEGGIPRIDKNLCIECGECVGMCASDAIVYSEGPGTPDTDPENWHNEATPEDIWMAVRKKSAGEWGDWEICKIKGEKGTDGVGIRTTEIRYAVGSNGITPPITGWVENPPPVNAGMYLWTRTIISYTDGTSSTSYSVARQGEPGQRGAALVYRGTYNINPHTGESEVVTYYGTPARVDVVYYPETSKYYVALPTTDEGEEGFRDKEPTNTRYWLEFGASFDSIATGLLFAQEQYVDKLTVRDLKTYERNNLYLQISSEDNCFKVVDSSGKVKLRIDGGSQLFSAYDDDGIEILQISGNEINAIPEDLGLPIRFSVNMNSLKYDGDTATDEMFQSDYCNMKEDSLGLGLSCYLYKDANYSLGNKGARRGKIFGSCSIPNGGRLRMSWVYGKLDITPAPEHSGPGRENGQMAYCRHLEWRISLNGDSILYGDSWSFRGHYPVIGTPLHSDLNIDGAVTVNIDDNEKVASGGTLTITMVFEFYTEYAYYKRFNGGVIPSGVTCPYGWEEYYVDTPYGSFVSGTITPRFSITKIGRNGLYSAWDATKHLFYNHLYGFELLATNNGIRVTADGVYVRLAGTWYKINRGTGYINTDASGSNRRQVAFLELTTQ